VCAFATRLTELQSVAAQHAKEVTASGYIELEPSFTQFVVVHVLSPILEIPTQKAAFTAARA
jgi:isoprenylcysteine carboxyl methyltransferase (ICMT) family protein YpbQ